MNHKYTAGTPVKVKVTNVLSVEYHHELREAHMPWVTGTIVCQAGNWSDPNLAIQPLYKVRFTGKAEKLLRDRLLIGGNITNYILEQDLTSVEPPEPYTTNVPGDFPKKEATL